MPAQRVNEGRRNFRLPIIVGDRFTEKTAAVGRAQGFEGVGIQTRSADARENRIEEIVRELRRAQGRRPRLRGGIYGFAGHRITIIMANPCEVKAKP